MNMISYIGLTKKEIEEKLGNPTEISYNKNCYKYGPIEYHFYKGKVVMVWDDLLEMIIEK